MAENKILVQIIDHENGDSVLGQRNSENSYFTPYIRLRFWHIFILFHTTSCTS